MELERMPPGADTSRRLSSSSRRSAAATSSAMGPPMEHLNLSLPLHVQVPPLPSPNTTAAAAALFRVNQLPPAASPTVGVFSFSKAAKANSKRLREAPYAHPHHPHHHALSLSLPTPTTAAAAAAAMALSASSPASAASAASAALDEHNKTASAYMAGGASSPDAASASASASAESNRRRKVGIPKFLRFLFQMLEYEDQQIIAWSHDGTAFQIRDPDELAERVLPKYFKHNKVSSFQRQLNYFGFKKWTKTQTNICTFSHPCFVRDEQENMRLIKRKERSTRGGGGGGASGGGGGATQGEQDQEDAEEDDQDQDEPDGEALSDEAYAHDTHARPAKRAKVQQSTATAKQRPTSAAGRRTAAAVKHETKQKTASKPPRAKKSPRGARGMPAVARGFKEELQEKEEGEEEMEEGSERVHKLQLPTISPASLASTLTSSSFSRLDNRGGDSGGSDAAPVMPIHADMMLQQSSLYGRRLPGGGVGGGGGSGSSLYDSGSTMQDLSESFSVGQSAWQSSYGLSSFKFSDPTNLESSFDMGNTSGRGGPGNGSSGGYGSAPAGMTSTKDYLDVLLESANMDDQISAQSSVGSNDSGIWEAAYRNNQQLQHPHQLYGHEGREQTHSSDRRMSAEAAMATYNMLSGPQSEHADNSTGSSQMGMQLPSIEDLQGMRY